jgi:hypothetical protein
VYARAGRCPEAQPCRLERRCPNAEFCNAPAVPAWRTGYCIQCTVSLACHKVTPTAGTECPVCLEPKRLVATPARCGHGVCIDCFRTMYYGAPLPPTTVDQPAYADAVVQWFQAVPPSWETQACPLCRAAPSAQDRVSGMIASSMLEPEELTNASVLPARIAFVVQAAKIARRPRGTDA